MCTAATYQSNKHYFGRNLDYEFSYGETAVIIPRNFPFTFREVGTLSTHYAIMGIAYLAKESKDAKTDYPLLYDAINEKGLGIAGLNFVGNTVFHDPVEGKDNIAQFELLPWLLGRCSSVADAKTLLDRINLRSFGFTPELPPSELHWILHDITGACIVVESVADGLKIYDNPAGVLTNNPPFDEQLFSLNNYIGLSAKNPENTFGDKLPLTAYSRGMGGMGLPGDLSSQSRFAKVAFTRANSKNKDGKNDDEMISMGQFFHILHSVDQQYGCCDLGENKYEHTLYSSCYNLDDGIFYYTTYTNHQITAIKMHSADLDSKDLVTFPVIEEEQVNYLN